MCLSLLKCRSCSARDKYCRYRGHPKGACSVYRSFRCVVSFSLDEASLVTLMEDVAGCVFLSRRGLVINLLLILWMCARMSSAIMPSALSEAASL